jgi:hypothetical protein
VSQVGDDGNIYPITTYPMGGALKLGSLMHLAGIPVAPITDLGVNQGKVLTLRGGSIKLEVATSVLTPLSNIRYLDGGTSLPLTSENGSIGNPYSSISSAISQVSGITYPGPTLLVTPGNYSGDLVYWLSTHNPPNPQYKGARGEPLFSNTTLR